MTAPISRTLAIAASLCLAAAGLPDLRAAARPPARPARSADHFLQTKEHIDALLKFRLNPDPLPANPPNPFQLPGETPGAESRVDLPAPKGDPTTPIPLSAPAPSGTDSEALAFYVANLKITGTVKLNGQAHLIINQSPYKEGDLVLLSNQSTTVYLQVIRITPTELTLGLNQAVQVIPLKN